VPVNDSPLRTIAAPDAGLGRADPTRRWAIAFPDGSTRFAGLTRPEAEAALGWLAAGSVREADIALVAVALPVVLSDGAGPHLLDARGRLVLALGPHPAIAGASIAMGPAEPAHPIGLVRPDPSGGWRWIVRAEVAPEDRVDALDRLHEVDDERAARAWAQHRSAA
jgi:hypothetical protein